MQETFSYSLTDPKPRTSARRTGKQLLLLSPGYARATLEPPGTAEGRSLQTTEELPQQIPLPHHMNSVP